ncbi:MAG: conserved virulence factor C family protein [Solibacillus sp.]
MKILSIEPTPSPNSMKIVIDHELPFGTSFNYTKDNITGAPADLQAVFAVDGVKGIYHVADFLAVERNAKFAWEQVLAGIRAALGEGEAPTGEALVIDTHFGEVNVQVQMYKGLPIQVKAFDSEGEARVSTGDRFIIAFKQLQMQPSEENYIYKRQWVDFGVRYGDKDKVAADVAQEVDALYPQARVARLVEQANTEVKLVAEERKKVTIEQFQVDDWQQRFQLLDQLPDPEVADIPLLTLALNDEQMAIRRLATVYLGMIEDVAVVPALTKALQDKSAAVRRTAGDCMSDLGLPEFEPAMILALADKNKLVRWRAAMYLFETGTEAAVPALRVASEDKEFEVKLQAKMALARIEEGEEAQGSVWKQMTDIRK